MYDRTDQPASVAAFAGVEEAAAAPSESERARIAGLLAAARQRSGRSLTEISRTTKISTRCLRAIEDGRLDLLPPGVYRRAMLRDYARCVGLDPDLVLQLPPPDPGSSPPAHQGTTPGATAPLSSLPALPTWAPSLPSVALGIVLGAALATFIADRGAGDERVAEPKAADVVAPSTARADSRNSASSPDVALDNAATSGVASDIGLEPILVIPVDEPTRLVVTSDPAGARVTVDGVGWGVTPLTIQHLSPGDKIVRVTKDGFLAREQRVRVEGRAVLRVTLRPRS